MLQPKLISSFRTRKVEELLAFLFLNTDIAHTREKLIELLWPGISNDNGRSRLSTTLWRIRVLLKPLEVPTDDILESTTESVTLCSNSKLQVDVNLFQDCVAAAGLASSSKEKKIQFNRS